MKKYFFGFLFVKIARILAVLALVAGSAFAALRVVQSSVAAESVAYQPLPSLGRQIDLLLKALSATRQIVSTFTPADESRTPTISAQGPTAQPKSEKDFRKINEIVQQADRERGLLKTAVITDFDTAVSEIESRLRAHAASFAAQEEALPTPDRDTDPPTDLAQAPLADVTSLYATRLRAAEINERTSTLRNAKQVLSVLRDSAENSDNRERLGASLTQLDSFIQLLPAPSATQPSVTTLSKQQPNTVPNSRDTLPAETVAATVRAIRADVRDAVLSSWSLDDAFQNASASVADEEAKCRRATLAAKGIWLAAAGQICAVLILTGFFAFFILVTADLTRTLLDTAVNTGVLADYYSQAADQG